jgi:hypothetical protein
VFWPSADLATAYWSRHAALLRYWRREAGRLACVSEYLLPASTPQEAANAITQWLTPLQPRAFVLDLMIGASELRLGLMSRPAGARSSADWLAAAHARLFPAVETNADDWRVVFDPLPGGAHALCAAMRLADLQTLATPFRALGARSQRITPICVVMASRYARVSGHQCAVAISEPGAIASFAVNGAAVFVAHLTADDTAPLLRTEAVRAALAVGIDIDLNPTEPPAARPSPLAKFRLDLAPAAADTQPAVPPQPDAFDRFTQVF